MRNLLLICTCLTLVIPCMAETITVDDDGPADFNTIQAAIDAAVNGDVVIVADGNYTGEGNKNLDFRGKPITVCSENGPNNCIIDCENSGRGFLFINGETENSVVEGFTLTNGGREGIICWESNPTITNCIITNNSGGGIYCFDNSSPTITNCAITDNVGSMGGGIYCFDNSSPTITNCIISGNSAGQGGGICCGASSPTITNCIITGNSADYAGGGIDCLVSSPIITNCTISGNSTEGAGGAISCRGRRPTITNCIISGNSARDAGGAILFTPWGADDTLTITNCTISENTGGESGGIYCEKASLVITDCTISENTGEWSGGIWCTEGSLDITGCTIAGNSSEGEWALGGGISCWAASPTITNCTIIGNSAKGHFLSGGGIFNTGGSPFISNCIIAGNSAERGGGISCGGGSTTITNCTITGNLANEYGGGILIGGSDRTTLVNCTFAGNSALNGNAVACDSYEQCHPSDLFMVNSILWDGGNEIWNNDGSTITITYSDVQGSWPGEGNTDLDPCFVEPGYWDANDTPDDVNDDFWIEGDYYLLRTSPCVDAGTDANVYTDIEGNVRPFDFPGVDNNGELPEFDMGAYELVPVEAAMKLTPQALNCNSKGKYIKAHFVLPEGFLPEDVDVNEPAWAEPMGAESEYIEVFNNNEGPVKLDIIFDREAFCETITETGEIEVTVIGSLTAGRYFYATDTIRIKPQHQRITYSYKKNQHNP